MKKIIAVILLLIMCLSCFACMTGNDITSTDTQTDTGSANTGTKPNGGNSTYVPNYAVDTTPYKILPDATKTTFMYLNEKLDYPKITKYQNGKKAALSMTFDDANNPNAGIIISEIFEKYGMRGTIMATVSTMKGSAGSEEASIQAWQKVFDLGYLDLGAHGYNHADPTDLPESSFEHEIGDAFRYLREKFPSQRVLTYATPLARITNSYESYLKEWCVTNRLETGGNFAAIGTDYNMYRIYAKMIKEGTNLLPIMDAVEASVDAERWIVHLFHDIIEDDEYSNYNPTTRSTFEGYCRLLYNKYADTVWFGSYEEVAIYALQYDYMTVDYTGISRNSLTFKVDCTLEDDRLYEVPVGMSVQLPRFTNEAYAVINGETVQKLELTRDGTKIYSVVKDVPIYDTEVQIFFSGNTTFRNGCTRHIWQFLEATEPDKYGLIANTYICTTCECTYVNSYIHESEVENKNENETANSENGELNE